MWWEVGMHTVVRLTEWSSAAPITYMHTKIEAVSPR